MSFIPKYFVRTLLATGDADSFSLLFLNALKAAQRPDLLEWISPKSIKYVSLSGIFHFFCKLPSARVSFG
jgi:hypothetical protein